MENCLVPVFVIFSCFAGIFCMKVSGLLKYGMFERKKFIMKRKKAPDSHFPCRFR